MLNLPLFLQLFRAFFAVLGMDASQILKVVCRGIFIAWNLDRPHHHVAIIRQEYCDASFATLLGALRLGLRECTELARFPGRGVRGRRESKEGGMRRAPA